MFPSGSSQVFFLSSNPRQIPLSAVGTKEHTRTTRFFIRWVEDFSVSFLQLFVMCFCSISVLFLCFGVARAIRVTGGSAAAVRAALQLRCDVCESQQHPESLVTQQPLTWFVLADYEGNQLSFINILDFASTFGVVAMITSKHPKIVWDHYFKHWIFPFGVPRRLIYDHGGEFEREFG